MQILIDQIDIVIEAAKAVQAEQRLDLDYRLAAEVELAEQRAKLILLIEGKK